MRAAVAAFDDQVAPRFDGAVYVLIATVDAGHILGVTSMAVRGLKPEQLPGFLAGQQVDTLVCGGITPADQQQLDRLGIDVIWGVIGPAASALCRLAEGTLVCDQFIGTEQDSAATRRCRDRWQGFLGIRPPLRVDRDVPAESVAAPSRRGRSAAATKSAQKQAKEPKT